MFPLISIAANYVISTGAENINGTVLCMYYYMNHYNAFYICLAVVVLAVMFPLALAVIVVVISYCILHQKAQCSTVYSLVYRARPYSECDK